MASLTVPTTQRMPAQARREQLLDVTAAIVGDGGFQAVSIQSVARAAGISRPIVYEHFGDLNGLLEALIKREMTRAREQVAETALDDLSEGDPIDLMLVSLGAYLGAVGLRQAVRPGLRPGEESEDPDLTARTLSAIADEYARLVLLDPSPPDRLLAHARWFLGQLSPDERGGRVDADAAVAE